MYYTKVKGLGIISTLKPMTEEEIQIQMDLVSSVSELGITEEDEEEIKRAVKDENLRKED